MRALWNFLAFQFGWFACVTGGANSVPWVGVLAGRFNGFEPVSPTRHSVSEAA